MERVNLVRRDRAASSDGESVVRYRLEAGEVEWEIAPGRKVRGYGFNGQVPGPVLEAQQGVPLEIAFTNRLPEPTVIHWHGLRIPAAMDGTEVVQCPVQPGETFTYRFTPPDAGTFWYHPHANETEQLEKGLYGALIVRAADELGVIGDVVGKSAIIVDDEIDTAGSIVGAAEIVAAAGARTVYAACTHALLTGPAVERLRT